MSTEHDHAEGLPLLVAKQLSKSYRSNGRGTIEAVRNLNLTVHQKQIVCILGPTGCGKSTLLRLIAGLEAPTSGTLTFAGSRIKGPGRDRGLVFQAYGSFPWLNVRRNVEFGLKHMGVTLPARRQRAAETLELVGLQDYVRLLPHELSGGMQQRLALARSLATRPRMLLLDEPFGSVDAITRDHLHASFRRIVNSVSSSAIMVTHDVEESLLLADRVLVMSRRPGHIVFESEHPILKTPWEARQRGAPEFQLLRRELTSYLEGGLNQQE